MTQVEIWVDELRVWEAEMRNRAALLNDHPPYTDHLRGIWTDTADRLLALRNLVVSKESND